MASTHLGKVIDYRNLGKIVVHSFEAAVALGAGLAVAIA